MKTTRSINDTNLEGSMRLEVFFEGLECGEHRERELVARKVRNCAEQGLAWTCVL